MSSYASANVRAPETVSAVFMKRKRLPPSSIHSDEPPTGSAAIAWQISGTNRSSGLTSRYSFGAASPSVSTEIDTFDAAR